ncbi:MAG: beta-CASP ribonuclease aCPSF1 [Candidatus Bathyarchaeia archaeon]
MTSAPKGLQTTNSILGKVMEALATFIPSDVEITRVQFEGAKIALYARKPEILLIDKPYIVPSIVNSIRKRIVVRSDPSIRRSEADAERLIKSILPKEAGITNIVFDPTLGEVIIEAKNVGLAVGKDGSNLNNIIQETKWIPRVLRSPQIPSRTITQVRQVLYSESKEREHFLRSLGEAIFRPLTFEGNEVIVRFLGGFREVGRSCILVETRESKVMLDCGINPGASKFSEMFPRLDIDGLDLSDLDAVVVSHGHLDHCGAIPFLYKYGYDGPIYCSEPTLPIMTLVQLDFLDVMTKSGYIPPYDQKDVRSMIVHTIPIRYGYVVDIAPDIKLTLWNAGHILGSSIVHLHIGEGLFNIVYTGDFKYGKTMLFEPAHASFPRAESLIMESTYGAPKDLMAPRTEVEASFVNIVNSCVEKGGKVLIPTPAIGRAQEILMVVEDYMESGKLEKIPVYIEGMVNEATGIHTAYPEYLSRDIRDKILRENVNPFKSEWFIVVNDASGREEALAPNRPAIIIATSGMMEGGPVIEYFKNLCEDPRNTLLFVSYQVEGTLGRKLKNGLREVTLPDEYGRVQLYQVKMEVLSIEGFSGHSDRRQLLRYVGGMKPKPRRVVVYHGEESKTLNLASTINRMLKIEASSPTNLEALRFI